MEPARRTVSPKVVLSATLKVTATDETVVQGGKGAVAEGVVNMPWAEVAEQVDGTVLAVGSPHEAGI